MNGIATPILPHFCPRLAESWGCISAKGSDCPSHLGNCHPIFLLSWGGMLVANKCQPSLPTTVYKTMWTWTQASVSINILVSLSLSGETEAQRGWGLSISLSFSLWLSHKLDNTGWRVWHVLPNAPDLGTSDPHLRVTGTRRSSRTPET